MTSASGIFRQYQRLLGDYIATPDEAQLFAISELGREAASKGLPREEVGKFHGKALAAILRSSPNSSATRVANNATAPLIEILMAYETAYHRGDVQREAHLGALKAREELYRQMFMSQQALQLIVDPRDGTIFDANPAVCEFYGRPADKLKKSRLSEISDHVPAEIDAELRRAEREQQSYLVFRHRVQSGELRDVEIHSNIITVDDRRLLHWILHDVTERKRADERIQILAQTDPLTGLANRTMFHDRLEAELSAAGRDDQLFALMLLDLDHFKAVNDNFGRAIGDALLKEVAQCLTAVVRGHDTVARLGGDEFAIILCNLHSVDIVRQLASRIIDKLSGTLTLDGSVVDSTCSVGVSLYPHDDVDADELIRKADLALYQAKAEGREAYRLFDSNLQAKLNAKAAMTNDLRLALVRDEFRLHYQPQIRVADGSVIGVEALVRWQHPSKGLLSPQTFIPLAEDSGFIASLGSWVLWAACRQNKAWQDAGTPGFRVAVNVSAIQFATGDFDSQVQSILDDVGLEPHFLELEITEGVMIDYSDDMLAQLDRLSEMGVQLSVDDFGTGYSSLAYLRRLPVHRLKIDQSFVRGLPDQADDAAIADAVIRMAHSLKLDVVAEGVETKEQAAFLRRKGCDEMQGYLFSRPLPPEELVAWLDGGPQAIAI